MDTLPEAPQRTALTVLVRTAAKPVRLLEELAHGEASSKGTNRAVASLNAGRTNPSVVCSVMHNVSSVATLEEFHFTSLRMP